ncbi:MAG: DNA-directed RNA polymerase subunit L [Candidatus Diapherotrites archaeon CG10_big_fil_rev_8_21_14_0_10_31_34]|nr:MAG: DNA-directed RNA polymerase subunit L [Candidatus Diapherotrites archaeon CG10_big_fil_rev_8_21_14_0_10_31_34]
MEIEVIKEEKNLFEFRIKGERHTLPNLLKTKLLEDKEVEFVAYKLNHPLDQDSIFVLRTKDKAPKKVLLNALKDIDSDLDEFIKEIKKTLK